MVVAHEKWNALVQGVFHSAVAGLVAVPHLVLFTPAVKFSRLLSEAEEMFISPEQFVLDFPGTLD